MRWAVDLSSAAIRNLDRLPERVLPGIVAFIYGPLAENPYRVGKLLGDDFNGYRSARRGEYRVVYVIEEDIHAVTVARIAHRADAYRPR